MKLQKYILPVFVGTKLLSQNEESTFPEMSFGFSHSVYNSTSFKATLPRPENNSEFHHKRSNVTETQYGFGIGLFLWMPLNEGIVFKPKIEGTFSTSCNKHNKSYATCFDLSFSHAFAISLKSADANGIIYVARDMSCYLTSKQPYLLMGPKLNLKKFDSGYIHKGYQNEFSYGFFIGYGINYEFHGTNMAPEITYGVSSTSQNQIDGSKKVVHTITLALNFF